MKVRFVFPANIEFDEAVRYYDHQLPGLGFRFFQQVDAAIERIRFMPEAWTKIDHRTRRCILKGFPYALFYAIEKDDILITAVAHLHREPEYYRNRII
ncbi:MAG: type II toxin-antitoxin system RelE/ParE family toxin [Deltaproteobacteria bacterium]|nr:type II toxin-antitoxin system RelE/ParE family toxin [Deltaproteobacteria bacterium]